MNAMARINGGTLQEGGASDSQYQRLRRMYQAAILAHIRDATYPGALERRKLSAVVADRMIRGANKDFRFLCECAGLDADFISEKYAAGEIKHSDIAGFFKRVRGAK